MPSTHFENKRQLWWWPALAAALALTVMLLRYEGRIWWCTCGQATLWASDIRSAHNSQHLLDAYSFTHMLHGLVLCGVAAYALPKLSRTARFCLAIGLECLWEVFENSAFVINRYREATISLGYVGDSVLNSMGDIVCCATGVVLASYLGFKRSLILFFVVDVALLLIVRDSLVLNIIMLIYPIDAIKAWQMGQ